MLDTSAHLFQSQLLMFLSLEFLHYQQQRVWQKRGEWNQMEILFLHKDKFFFDSFLWFKIISPTITGFSNDPTRTYESSTTTTASNRSTSAPTATCNTTCSCLILNFFIPRSYIFFSPPSFNRLNNLNNLPFKLLLSKIFQDTTPSAFQVLFNS